MIIVVFAFVFLFLFPSSIVTHKWMFLFFHLFLRLIKYFNYNTMWCLLRMQWRMHSSEGIQSGNYRCCLFLRSTTAMSFDIKFLLVENKKNCFPRFTTRLTQHSSEWRKRKICWLFMMIFIRWCCWLISWDQNAFLWWRRELENWNFEITLRNKNKSKVRLRVKITLKSHHSRIDEEFR